MLRSAEHTPVTARFKAWSDGRREELIRWWREARTRAWAEADKDRVDLGDSQEAARRYSNKIQRAQHLIGEGEISRGGSQALSEGAANATPYVREQLRTKFPRRAEVINDSLEGAQKLETSFSRARGMGIVALPATAACDATGGPSAVGRQVDRVRSATLLSRLDSLVLVACHETRPTVLPTMVGAP